MNGMGELSTLSDQNVLDINACMNNEVNRVYIICIVSVLNYKLWALVRVRQAKDQISVCINLD